MQDSEVDNYLISIYKLPTSIVKTLKQDPISCILESNKAMTGGLFLGNIYSALSNTILKKYKIEAVLTIIAGAKISYRSERNISHLIIYVQDLPQESIKQYFDKMVSWIRDKLSLSNVLIHCMGGISRSSTAVIAYLLKEKQMTTDQALKLVQEKRPIAHPNCGFMRQLLNYEKRLSFQQKFKQQQFLREQVLVTLEDLERNCALEPSSET